MTLSLVLPLVLSFSLSLVFVASRELHLLDMKRKPSNPCSSTAIFELHGNVYPEGFYYVTVEIGNPPKPYFLDIDSGSDLTWLQCDAPCVSCSPNLPHPLYKPKKQNIVKRDDADCLNLQFPRRYRRKNPEDQCDYHIVYADGDSSLGVLVHDSFSLFLSNGSKLRPDLAIGCGYDQRGDFLSTLPKGDGVLGMGGGKISIPSQLRNLRLTTNLIGHCFGGNGGGYIFFGDEIIPGGVTWAPLTQALPFYSPGPANLTAGKSSPTVDGLTVVFDSGSTYTYFSGRAYEAVLASVEIDITGKFTLSEDDDTLPLCMKGSRPFKNVAEVENYFSSFELSFGKETQLTIPPEGYLIISSQGNVCLGVLNGTEFGLTDHNIFGDVSMQNLMVIYDNEKQRIGWIPSECNKISSLPCSSLEVEHLT
ncbi:aspartic proteinase Asp1-like isoform X2 [Aristolochia californica]|uniref:aspartic proteinase Asp1-like isoform X2 n=1 Tax=Aristolochia californica TaxID=171875 RepID=UPI0035DD6508